MQSLKILFCYFTLVFGQIPEKDRVDCFPSPEANQFECTQRRQCLWDNATNLKIQGTPRCYYPRDYGYKVESKVGNSVKLVKMAEETKKWYEPPINLPKSPSTSTDQLTFLANTTDTFFFKITRNSNGRVLFDTSIGGLIFADQFLQIATYLPSVNFYGFGENVHQSLKHDLSRFKTWPLFARDEAPYSVTESFKNLYGIHPFYLNVEPDGKVHGLLLLNSNAQEYTTGPGPSLIYRTIGGVLDLYFFPGPTAGDVITQYLSLIGKPLIPPYWGLGFQLCRWGYLSLDKVKKIVRRMLDADIPYDVQWMDIDYMNHRMDFTYNRVNFSGLPEFVDEIHDLGMKQVFILDPAIPADYGPFERGISQNIFIRWPNESYVPDLNDKYPSSKGHDVMLGTVWPDKNTAFPDWLNPRATEWWMEEIKTFHETIDFDGLWIDMNEPSNFGTNSKDPWYNHAPYLHHAPTPALFCPHDIWDSPPYSTWAVYQYSNARLSTKTLCMNGMQADGQYRHYDVHNLYGFGESLATQHALTSITHKRSVLIARSTFVSSGRYTGHWLGDNSATWDDMRTSIIGVLEFNFFGIPYIGADICGLNLEAQEEMCLRWHQLGAFHSFSRNHNGLTFKDQDPARWPSVAQAARKALRFRYHYLPFLYSLHFDASLIGSTVIRPLFFEFPNDAIALDIDKQFMWGSALLITPVLTTNVATVKGYIPDDDWYSLYDFNYGKKLNQTGWVTFQAPTTSLIPVHVRGGHIIPRQAPHRNTEFARVLNPFELLVVPNNENTAKGFMYWDNGHSIIQTGGDPNRSNYHQFHFSYAADDEKATIHFFSKLNASDALIFMQTLDIIEIFGYNYLPIWSTFELNGKQIFIDTVKSNYLTCQRILYIQSGKLIALDKIPASGIDPYNFWTFKWKHIPNSIVC